ncbi:hypothetical protein [Blastopirellula marina]|uniref:Uncharacterized protein n=1 Tax=Blastopirellula marina DSM 3645 TaxID=314230 RepID=A4A0L4_9BACT|nr:hypothetical protein [Blastopirellula marina]EAQ77680.1 hypothetical protein DSM3645_01896 [Blastopirellula marina DSM 3645]
MIKRKPKPWFHKQSGNWKVQLGTKQINLGSDEAAAWDEYNRLMAASAGPEKNPNYDLQYYFEARHAEGGALWPNWLNETPYVVTPVIAP